MIPMGNWQDRIDDLESENYDLSQENNRLESEISHQLFEIDGLKDRIAGLETDVEILESSLAEANDAADQEWARSVEIEEERDKLLNQVGLLLERAEKAETHVRQLTWQRERLTALAHVIEERAEKAEAAKEAMVHSFDAMEARRNDAEDRAEKAEAALVKARSVNEVLRHARDEATEHAEKAEADARTWFEVAKENDEQAESAYAELAKYRAETWTDHDGTVRPIIGTRASLSREVYDWNEQAGHQKLRAEKAEEANRYLERDLRHAREDYEALSESWDRLQDDWEFQAKMNQKNARELIELKKALRVLGGQED